MRKIKDHLKENAMHYVKWSTYAILCVVIIDILNIPIVADMINFFIDRMMITEWFALLGFVVALAVPTLLYFLGEYNRKVDKKDTEEENEKQFVCNIINNYKKLYWNNELISILYGQDGSDELKDRIQIIQLNYLYTQYESAIDEFTEFSNGISIKVMEEENSKLHSKILSKMYYNIVEEIALINLVEELISSQSSKKVLIEIRTSLHESLEEVNETLLYKKDNEPLVWPFEWVLSVEV